MAKPKIKDCEDQRKRERIPTVDDVPTQYRPTGRLLMVVPLPAVEKVGTIIIPDRHQEQMNEGHVVAKGKDCTSGIEEGDCVVWGQSQQFNMDVDDVKFVLVPEASCMMVIKKADLAESAAEREPKES